MKELSLYKVDNKEGKTLLMIGVKDLLQHLRELDVMAMRDDKQILATLIGECSEALGEISIARKSVEKEIPEPKSMGKPVRRSVPEPDLDLESMPKPSLSSRKKAYAEEEASDDDEVIPDEEESDEEAEEEVGEEFKLR